MHFCRLLPKKNLNFAILTCWCSLLKSSLHLIIIKLDKCIILFYKRKEKSNINKKISHSWIILPWIHVVWLDNSPMPSGATLPFMILACKSTLLTTDKSGVWCQMTERDEQTKNHNVWSTEHYRIAFPKLEINTSTRERTFQYATQNDIQSPTCQFFSQNFIVFLCNLCFSFF